jgi:hypothetical protein
VEEQQNEVSINATSNNAIFDLVCVVQYRWRKILGFHVGNYEECRLLGSDVVWLLEDRRFGGAYCFHHQGEKNQ